MESYKDALDYWEDYACLETQVSEITSNDLKRYLVWTTTEYTPKHKNGKPYPRLKMVRHYFRIAGRDVTSVGG